MERSGQINLAVDFGDGRQADVELGTSDQLWIAVGPGLAGADMWLKAGGRVIDLRVLVRRTETGIEIAVDRGADERRWWSAEAAPRMAVVIDPSAATATAFASAGNSGDYQQVVLGRVSI